MLFVTTAEDGSFTLSTAGYALAIVIFAGILLFSAALLNRKHRFNARQLAFSSVAIAIATVTSMIPLFRMPMGGTVTLFSMMFVTLIGWWYGFPAGLAAAVAYGILQLITEPYIISFPQMIVDYILAFGALSLAGLFHGKKLIPGYLLAVAGRYFFAVLSGVIFFGMYAPEEFPNPLVYSLAYNGAYLGVEAAVTVGVLLLPPVAKAMNAVKRMATGDSVPVKTGNATS